jgi:threonylcarbamoyladenosine tRNA methylthiotransferase MtaB
MKVGIYSLGCKVNIYESEYVENLLKDNNFEIVPFEDKADIYIINTCSVTNEADKKSRKIIKRARRENENAIIIAMGCYTQVKSADIDDIADIILGNKDKSKIISLINEVVEERKKIKKIYNLRDTPNFEKMEISNFDNHTRAFVKIQDGCNAFCSYCIIPYTRGKIRSKAKEDVIKEVSKLVRNGYKEIVLTGIHTGKYGLDLENTSLEDLLNELVKIKGLYRLRLSSIEINEITDGIMKLIKENKIIASHLHIPLQSGDDKILKLMNRKYNKKYFIDKVEKIKKLRKDISITTDLIVGFPNENDENFTETIDTLNKIGFTKIHIFPYSRRDNTKASVMPNQVDSKLKKDRCKKVSELSKNYEYKYYNKFLNQELDGISEKRRDNTTVVLTSNYISVIVKEKLLNNQIVRVKITKIDENNLVYGEIIK